jgi:DHA2 family multidrug resistance protein
MGFLFVPIQTLCYIGIPQEKNNNVSGMTNLARNLGGSLGISAISVIVSRRAQYHQSVLASHTSQYDTTFQQSVAGLTQTFQTLGSDVAHATTMAHQMLYSAMQRQAALLGYIDAIFVFSLVCAVMAPAAFLMQKPQKGVKARSGH